MAEPPQRLPTASADNAARLQSLYSEEEQNKHAIAVPVAAAAAADAAIASAAAAAAAAVVRLNSHGIGTMFGGVKERIAAAADASIASAAAAAVRLNSHGIGTMFGGVKERIAAFRGYLNEHAIAVPVAAAAAADAAIASAEAAAAVVRLNSHGIGTMFGGVKERIAAAADAAIASAEAAAAVARLNSHVIGTMFGGVKERIAAAADAAIASAEAAAAVVRLNSHGIGTMFGGVKERIAAFRGNLVRRQVAGTFHSMQALIRAQAIVRAHKSRVPPSHNRRILPETCPRKSPERFDETRSEQMLSFHSRRLSGNPDSMNNGFDMSSEIVEIDTCPSKSRSFRSRTSPSLMDSAEDMTISSRLPARILIPDCCNIQDYDWRLTDDKCRYSSIAQSTSHYMNSAQSMPHYMNSACIAPATPEKRVNVANGMFRWFPNLLNRLKYMTNTQSLQPKVRSQNPPKQCLETGPRKRLPLSKVLIKLRASVSCVGMQRSCTRAPEVAAFNFKSVRFL